MKKILLTGATGFIGKNLLPFVEEKYEVVAPTRQELDLRDTEEVKEYLKRGNFDIVLHCANPNPVKNGFDERDTMLEDSLRIFLNFYRSKELCGKIYYFGSGAEYDKRFDISSVNEKQIGKTVPLDTYGFSKYIMNELALKSENVYNFRIFACYGPYDHVSKFITHSIQSCLKEEDITIRQNCYFDYFHVYDLAKILNFFIENTPKYHDYNICSGKRITLEEIAQEVLKQYGAKREIRIINAGLNKEYTADNSRLLQEIRNIEMIPIDKGIEMQIAWEKEFRCEKKSS